MTSSLAFVLVFVLQPSDESVDTEAIPSHTPSPGPVNSAQDALVLSNAKDLVDEQLSAVLSLSTSSADSVGTGSDSDRVANAAIWAGILADRVQARAPAPDASEMDSCPTREEIPGAFALNPVTYYVIPEELLVSAAGAPALTIDDYRLGSVDGLWMQAFASDAGSGDEITFRATACWIGSSGAKQSVQNEISVADDRAGRAAAEMTSLEKVPVDTEDALLNLTFDDTPNGLYGRVDAEDEWTNKNGRLRSYSVTPSDSLTRVETDGDGYLVKTFPKGTYNNTSDDDIDHKMTLHWESSKPLDSAYLSYRVKASDNFHSVRGGKLPGLCGGTCPTGGQATTDGSQVGARNNPDGLATGWSGRNMWRPGGKLVQYLYYPDQTTEYAPDFLYGLDKQNVYLNDGMWHTVEHFVQMNTPGKHNGIFKAWYDGRLVLDLEDIRYRDNDDFAVDLVKFTAYFGGHDESWAPEEDVWLAFDDIIVSRRPISH